MSRNVAYGIAKNSSVNDPSLFTSVATSKGVMLINNEAVGTTYVYHANDFWKLATLSAYLMSDKDKRKLAFHLAKHLTEEDLNIINNVKTAQREAEDAYAALNDS